MSNTFDGLPALQYLRIERNAINCDCNINDIVKRFDQSRTRVHILCDTPQHLHGQNFNNLNEKDLNCGKHHRAPTSLETKRNKMIFDFSHRSNKRYNEIGWKWWRFNVYLPCRRGIKFG